jgi:glutathione S-transferase
MCTTGEGPNPWKTVIVFEELDIPYHATYLDFGNSRGGVEHEDFLKKNPAGRVPWINDPATGEHTGHSSSLNKISN